MSNITKKVDGTVPVTQRTQVFTDADANPGDILLVKDSLGKSAKLVQIQADDTMVLSFNVLHTIYPPRDTGRGGYPFGQAGGNLDLSAGQTYTVAGAPQLTLAANETYTFDNDLPINDIQIIVASGTFEIFCA